MISAVEQQLKTLRNVDIESTDLEPKVHSYRVDLVAQLRIAGIRCQVLVEVKYDGAPRFVRDAVFQLESYLRRVIRQKRTTNAGVILPMVVAPYLSPQARGICRDHDVAYLDFVGNAYIAFDGVYIDRAVADVPKTEQRSLRSIFSPKAALVLRLLLKNPDRVWSVVELAEESGVSMGHVSNVRRALIQREWAGVSSDGLILERPDLVLQDWREHYQQPKGALKQGYTHLHEVELDDRVRDAMSSAEHGVRIVYSLNSAARWTAPYLRSDTTTLYVNKSGAMLLEDTLRLKPAVKGANVVYRVLRDETIFEDQIEPVPDVLCTNPVVTCLDLWSGNDRSQEAADHLAQKCFPWLD